MRWVEFWPGWPRRECAVARRGLVTCDLSRREHGVFARAGKVGENLGKLVVLGGPCQLGAGGEPPAWCWWPRRPWGPRTGCPRTGGPECGGCYRLYPTCELVSGLVESWVGLSATAAAAAAAAARLATWLLLLAMETWNTCMYERGRDQGCTRTYQWYSSTMVHVY